MHTLVPHPTLLKACVVGLLLFVGYKFSSAGYSYPRVDEMARLASQRLVAEAEKSGKPLRGTLLQLRKMLDSPLVQSRVIPGDFKVSYEPKLHAVSGFTIFYVDPISEPEKGTVTLNGKKVRLEELPPHLQEEMKEINRSVEAKLKAMGAVPYTIESSLQSLLKTLRDAQANNTAVVIASRRGDDLYSLVTEFMEYSQGEKFPGVTLVIITDSLSPVQTKVISRGLGTEPYQLSYKVGLHDFLPW